MRPGVGFDSLFGQGEKSMFKRSLAILGAAALAAVLATAPASAQKTKL